MPSPALRDCRDDNARFDIETGPGVDLTFELAERVVDRRLERRRRLGDSAVVPVLTVRYEPPLSDASCEALRDEQDEMHKTSWVGSVRIESSVVRPEAIELTLAPLTGDHVPLETLRRHARVGLSPELAVSFIVDVATAMSGAPHGGLHPRRVVVLADGEVKLVGTHTRGLSRVLAPALTCAEREAWTAPEVRWGDVPDASSDVFALGLLLFYLLTDDLDPNTLVRRARTAGHEPTIPFDLAQVIIRAVGQDPSMRYPDALAFGQAVTACLMPARDREVIVDALRFIIDAGRGGLAAMLGAVEYAPEVQEDEAAFSPIEDGPALDSFDALDDAEAAAVVEPEPIESRSIAISVAPVAGFERASEPERITLAPPVALDGPRVITEKSNVPSIESRPVVERSLPLPVREPAPLISRAAPSAPAPHDYTSAPELDEAPPPPSLPPPPVEADAFDLDVPWTPTHLPEVEVPEPKKRRRAPRFALAGVVAGLALAVGVGWTFAPSDDAAERAMSKVARRGEAAAEAPRVELEAPAVDEPPAPEGEVPVAPASDAPAPAPEADVQVADEAVVTPEPAKPLDLVTIMSRPSGATVFIDGRIAGRTPLVMKRELHPRDYAISVRLTNHRAWERTVRPDDKGAISVVAELEEDVAATAAPSL